MENAFFKYSGGQRMFSNYIMSSYSALIYSDFKMWAIGKPFVLLCSNSERIHQVVNMILLIVKKMIYWYEK